MSRSRTSLGGRRRVGLVGCGRLAEVGYLSALVRVPAFELVAVADVDPHRRRAVAALARRLPGNRSVTTHGDAASLLDATEVDLLILATPAPTHLDDARAAAARAVPVLVEKPPAPDAAGAAALAGLAPAPWVGFNRRFDPGAARVREVATRASDPLDLRVEIHYRRQSWGALGVHDDALGDLGPHLADWARWLTGSEVVEVRSAALAPQRAQVELVLERGRAVLDAATDRPYRELIELRGGTGASERHRLGGLVSGVLGRLQGGPHPLVQTLTEELRAVARALDGETDHRLGTAADGVAVMSVLDAARAAARSGAAVPVHHPPPPQR